MQFPSAAPMVVGTIRPQGLIALAASSRAERPCDIVEARLDLAAAPGGDGGATASDLALAHLQPFFAPMERLERTGSPVLATIRLVADGGRATVDAERLPWFEQALASAAWVDIEVESRIADAVVALAHARGRQAIVSHHDFAGTPSDEALDVFVERARAVGADVVKIATLVETVEDHHRLIDLLRRWRQRSGADLALIGMGAAGTALRSYLPCIGSRLTYGYLDAVAAPGQVHARELRRRLLVDCPAYVDRHRGELP